MFKLANEEFEKTAKELYSEHMEDLGLTVGPDKVIFLRSDAKKKDAKMFAYCKMISNEYELLTEKKFFIVVVSKHYDNLKTEDEKKYVILHELKHLDYNDENEKYGIVKHDLENFHSMVMNPKWNLDLTKKSE